MSAYDDINAGLDEIVRSVYVSGSTKKSYKSGHAAEYAKVDAYLEGGAVPSPFPTTLMGSGLVKVERGRRALVPDPPPPPPPPPPPDGQLLWNADLSTGDLSQYGGWEYGGTFDGTPPLSQRVQVAHSIDNYNPAQGQYLMKVTVAPGDQYGGSSGWRTICRLPKEQGGDLVTRDAGYDSSFTWAVLVPPGYPFGADNWLDGPEIHQTSGSPVAAVAPCHFLIFADEMSVDVGGIVGSSRHEYVNHQYFQGYEKGRWYVFTARYKHGLLPNGHFELWGGKQGDAAMQQIIAAPGIANIYPGTKNYMTFGHYRAQSGSSPSYLYFGGFREYSTLGAALAWANEIL